MVIQARALAPVEVISADVVEMPRNATMPDRTAQEAVAFKAAMRSLAGAVSVVTTGRDPLERTGFTATSVSSLSIEPPTLLVCLNRNSSSWPALQEHGSFCVNVLAHDQLHVADRFAGRDGHKGVARYEGAKWRELATGALALDGALAAIDCDIDAVIDHHTHEIIIGRVRAIELRNGAEPLLYWQGAYRLISSLDRVLTRA